MADAPSTSSRSEIVSLCGDDEKLGTFRVDADIACNVV